MSTAQPVFTLAGRLPHACSIGILAMTCGLALAAEEPPPTSYSPVVAKEEFESVMKRMSSAKSQVEQRQKQLLDQRYDLSDRPVGGVTMSRGKPVQEGVRVKLSQGTSWDRLSEMSPENIRDRGAFPAGFMPLPHPNHADDAREGRSRSVLARAVSGASRRLW